MKNEKCRMKRRNFKMKIKDKTIFELLLIIVFIMSVMVAVGVMTGCTTDSTTYTKVTAPDGTVTESTTTKTDGPALSNKSVALAGSAQAVKLESTGGATSGTVAPNVLIGGGNTAIGTSPNNEDKPVFAYSQSNSLLTSIFSGSASGISYIYIGISGEKADETEKRIKVFKGVIGNPGDVLNEE
jgi:hypothetical protein